MAQRTLLDMTQMILQALKKVQVDSIEETDDSLQVAQIIREVYYEGLANRNWPHKFELTSFAPLGVAPPTHMLIGTELKEIEWVKYNKQRSGETKRRYEYIEYKEPWDFVDFVSNRNNDNANIDIITDTGGTELLIRNDKQPEFWTSFDQVNLVMDSYDNTVDSTLQQSKVQVYGPKSTTFTLEDAFIPDVPEEAFPWLIAESKSVAFIDIAQEGNSKAEQQSRRQSQWLSRKSRKAGSGKVLASFGRTPRK
jgi:hypothetical protein